MTRAERKARLAQVYALGGTRIGERLVSTLSGRSLALLDDLVGAGEDFPP